MTDDEYKEPSPEDIERAWAILREMKERWKATGDQKMSFQEFKALLCLTFATPDEE